MKCDYCGKVLGRGWFPHAECARLVPAPESWAQSNEKRDIVQTKQEDEMTNVIDIVKSEATNHYYLRNDQGGYFSGFYERDSQWESENEALPFATEELARAQHLLLTDPLSRMV